MASVAVAQSDEYTAPGALGIDPGEDSDRLASAVDDAEWRLGALRIDPWFALRELAWVKPPEQDGDLTISVGAGLRAYLPIGSRTTFSAQVLPQYIWWQDRDEDRRFGGSYGVGLFYFADRASVQLSATASDLDDFVTDEVDRRAAVDTINYRLRVEVPVGSRFGVFANAGRVDQTVEDTFGGAGDLADLSSKTDRLEGGLTWRVASRLGLRAGVGRSETTFADEVRDRSNEGDYWLAGLDWRRVKTSVNLTYRQNDLQRTGASEFQSFDRGTWQGRVTWRPRQKLALAVYGTRALAYSALAGESTFVDERLGVRIDLPIGNRIDGGLFLEEGTRSYQNQGREDDVSTWGGQIGVTLPRRLRLSISARSTETDGALGTRSYREYRFGLRFGADHRGFY